MIELIDRLLDDRLWIYTSIIGALLGAAFLAYFKETHLGIYTYAKFDQFIDWLVERWGIHWFSQPEDAWRKKYPHVTKKIDELEARIKKLEKHSHPCKELHEFDVWPELDARIRKLEKK
jgi:hypothetical protein